MRKKILIAGYFGFMNTGDEVILSAMLQDIRGLNFDIDITVVSGNPDFTRQSHHVNSIAWADIQEINHSILDSDLVILGGGGLFHDYWGFDQSTILTSKHIGIPFYTSIGLLATLHSKPLMLYAVGVGPLFSDEGKKYVRAIADQAAIISVRDEQSKSELISIGIPSERITVTADPAYRLNIAVQSNKYDPEKPTLGVALRNWDYDGNPDIWEKQIAMAVDQFLDSYPGGNAVFIPFQDLNETLLDDSGVSGRIQAMLKNAARTVVINKELPFLERIKVLSACNLMVAMRLHAILFAIKYGIPVVGLIYDPKIINLMSQTGIQNYALDIKNFDYSVLFNNMVKAYQDHDRLSPL
ncbi:MAG: polysaccharide pyruvyl transferase family protein, partial [Anaerolineae bacterium]|nr:polysaccharide pyruvyl transferase family protein [Anaerolineae bacterium]